MSKIIDLAGLSRFLLGLKSKVIGFERVGVDSAHKYEVGQSTDALKMPSCTVKPNALYALAEGSYATASGEASHAEGASTTASGYTSHAEGHATKASGPCSHTEGYYTTASGEQSHAEGHSATASGNSSHAEGGKTIASSTYSHAEGYNTKAIGACSHAEGTNTTASGNSSHAEGTNTTASGGSSHAEGYETTASGSYSHAEGTNTTASGGSSHAEGYETTASGSYSHAEGGYTTASGHYSHAEGGSTKASGDSSHAEGASTTASGRYSHAEGKGQSESLTGVTGENCRYTCSSARTKFTTESILFNETNKTYARVITFIDDNTFDVDKTLGTLTDARLVILKGVAYGEHSHIEGRNTKAIGFSSHAEGDGTTAIGIWGSHAEGTNTTASGPYSHAEGWNTTASGDSSHAEGASTTASGSYSHAEGRRTTAGNISEHAEGQYNVSNSATTTYGSSGNTQHSVGIGPSYNDTKNAFEIMQNGDTYLYGVGGYDGTNATASTSSTLQKCVGKMEEITWSNLKSLRDSSGLTPGMQYRITDYNTTTTQEDTQSAGHQFDIIVVADDNHTLNENARAIRHAGDTYFSGATLEAWELKYDIDNDTDKYAWADSGSTGRGVIYYMKDEWNNECPYDFKNIQFDITDNAYSACYTFGFSDYTVNGSKNVYNNVIKEWRNGIRKQLTLNNIIFQIATVTSCHSNKFGINCHDNIFGDDCYNNIFGTGCYNNKFDRTCYNNIFGTDCFSNYFAGSIQGCHDNQFGNDCHHNMLSELCREITFGSGCGNNIFGEDCSHIRFGNECSYIKTGIVNRLNSFYRNIIVEDGNQHIYLNCTETLSDIRYYQNVKIALGVNNTTTWKTINDSNVNQNFETIYRPSNSLIISV